MKISGIYQIRNLINNKIYIGSSVDLYRRRDTHFSKLKSNTHTNKHLQSSYNKHGKETLVFEILITCHPDMLLWYEQQFLDEWKPEYNTRIVAESNLGYTPSIETRLKISKNSMGRVSGMLGKRQSEGAKQKIGDASSGENNHMFGRHHSKETIEKFRLAKLGKHLSEETKLKMRTTHKRIAELKKQQVYVRHGRKLSNEDVSNIIKMRSLGVLVKEISSKYDVSKDHIYRIAPGKRKDLLDKNI